MSYQAYSGDQFRTTGLILIVPRPSDAKYLAYTARTIKPKAARGQGDRGPAADEARRPQGDRHLLELHPARGAQDADRGRRADERFTAWLRESSTWVPLKVLLEVEARGAGRGRLPRGAVRAFLAAYHELEQAETHSPGQVSEAVATEFLTASRSLGEAVSTEYPSVPTIERETYFNATNPFWTGTVRLWFAVMLLVVGLAFVSTTTKESWAGRLGSASIGRGCSAC